ncbi:MFS transporter [Uniformispora flossi]|uniref:MFS transporter n=1 Tax=Uniformispora flossi TaxID=3390723 RepID=UPI003C2B1BB4
MNGRELFRDRRFAILFTARSFSVLGAAFGPVALAFGVLDLPGANATTLTIVLAAQAVPEVALMLFGGVTADRMSRARLMAFSETLSAVCFFAIAAMFLTGHAPVVAVAGAAAGTGVALALFYPALTGLVPDVVPEEHLQTANGVLRIGVNAARMLGLALAGAAVALIGPGWALVLNGTGFVASALLLKSLKVPPAARGEAPSTLRELREGWQEFRSRQWLWVIVLQFTFVIAGLQACMGVLGPVVAKADLGGAPAWSAVLIGEALGTFAGVFLAIRIRPRRTLFVATLAVLLVPLPFLLLGLGAPLAVVVAGVFVTGAAFDVFGVLWETTMQREIPREALSRVSAYDALGSFMFGPLGLVAAAPLADVIGARGALVAFSGLVVAATVGALLSPDVRRVRAGAPPAAESEPGPDAVPEPRGGGSDAATVPPPRVPDLTPAVAAALSPQSGSAHSSPQSSG